VIGIGSFVHAKAWLDDDGEHVWTRHVCASGPIEFILPPPWHLHGQKVEPSLSCELCGLHTFLEIEAKPCDECSA
jgi:hypothetical protein